ncbi:MAG: sulfatase [Planctomycetes bacterium]|nr:sulfatase [Planctomycetota bacterium]
MVAALYEAQVVRLGVADPRLAVERPVARRVASRERPSVILLQVETLRADALAAFAGVDGQDFGAPADLAPNFARLAQHATRWVRAMAPSPWTVPTSASLLTGLPPSAHGATRHERMALPGDVPTLAEVCARAGLATGAVVTSDLLSEPMGFARGFQSFAHLPYANARQVHDLAEAFLANHAGQQFLLFLHAFDPHSPYAAPEPWRDRYVEPELRGRTVKEVEDRLLARLKQAYAGGTMPAQDDPDLRWLRQRYLGEIAWWDSQLGVLLDALERLDLDGTTMLVITSDHGEEFLEHGLYGHGSNLHEETLHVPLLVAPPPGWRVALPAGGVAQEVVGTDALFASVLEWAGVPCDGEGVRPPLRRPQGFAFSETDKGVVLGGGDPFRRALDSVRTDALRAIVSWPMPDEQAEPRHELFDLRADPGAHTPRAPGSAADGAFDLIREAVLWCEAHRATAAPEGLSPAQMQALEQLGYVGERATGNAPADEQEH